MAPQEAALAMDESWDGAVLADALVEVLRRIPPSVRRRLRLVCRHWRDVIDERLPAPRACAKVLAFVREPWGSGSHGSASARNHAYVLDAGLREGREIRELDLLGFAEGAGASMVGSCNGLICLRRARGDLAVVNPATREKLIVPPATRRSSLQAEAAAYSFAFHPETGLYKIVHVPGAGPGGGMFDTVRVFTLGDNTSWRVTPAIGCYGRHELFGVASVGGATYWVNRDATLVVAFDLKDERVAFVKKMPVPVPLSYLQLCTFHLADIAGRLGFTVRRCEEATSKTEVWVLEGGREDQTWIRQYVIDDGQFVINSMYNKIPSPHFVHGERLLTQRWDPMERKTTLYAHGPRKEKFPRCEVVRVRDREQRTAVAKFDGYMYDRVPTFCHVETMEPGRDRPRIHMSC